MVVAVVTGGGLRGECYLDLHAVSGGGSSCGDSVTVDPTELARMQQWTDKAEARLRKSLKDGAGDTYSRSDGRDKRDTRRDRDRDSEKPRYARDTRGSGDRDSRGKSDRPPEPRAGHRHTKDTRRTARESTDERNKPGDPVQPVGNRSIKTGTMAIGASNDGVDYTKKGSFKLGGGRYFESAACVEYSFPREKALKMCFECGLSDFDDCAMCPTPAKKGHTMKTDECHAIITGAWATGINKCHATSVVSGFNQRGSDGDR